MTRSWSRQAARTVPAISEGASSRSAAGWSSRWGRTTRPGTRSGHARFAGEYRTEDIADVRFVPLVGEEGWAPGRGRVPISVRERGRRRPPAREPGHNDRRAAEPFGSIESGRPWPAA